MVGNGWFCVVQTNIPIVFFSKNENQQQFWLFSMNRNSSHMNESSFLHSNLVIVLIFGHLIFEVLITHKEKTIGTVIEEKSKQLEDFCKMTKSL